MKKYIWIIIAILFIGAYWKMPPLLVQLTNKSVNDINAKKIINIIPGDTIESGFPYESQHVSTDTYTSVAGVIWFKNVGSGLSKFEINVYTGPVGGKDWVKIARYHIPLDIGDTGFWKWYDAIYADTIYFTMSVDVGEIDAYKNITFFKSSVSP